MEGLEQCWLAGQCIHTSNGESLPSFQGSSDVFTLSTLKVTGTGEDQIEGDGVSPQQLASYLDEFMWFERLGTTVRQAFNNTCRDFLPV